MLDFLLEAVPSDRLDISILSADKYLTSDTKLEKFFNTPCTIEAKTDGVKVTVVKVADNGNLDDWIIAYKSHILYQNEFDYQPTSKVKTVSIGSSQFKLVLDHFSKIGKNSIPVGTELQLEYLMKKPTLSSNYTHPHGLVLIGYSKSTYTSEFGILKTANTGMHTEKRDQIAKELKLNVPLKLFAGVMNSDANFRKGILNNTFASIYEKYKNLLTFDNYSNLYTQLKSMLLDIPSMFGGKEEGVVVKFKDLTLKIQQSYQLDQSARLKIKQKYREDDPDSENAYWENVKKAALEIANSVIVGNRKIGDVLKDLSLSLKRYKLNFTHSKKLPEQIKDDIQLNAKTLVLKKIKGNAGCLVLGKFRILTNGHVKLIKDALKIYDRVAVCLISNKDTASTESIRLEMLKRVFGDKVYITKYSKGFIAKIFEKIPFNINAVYCGTDRVADYQKQVKSLIGVDIKEMPRGVNDISATKVIDNLSDESFFKKNTPKEIHNLYSQLVELYR